MPSAAIEEALAVSPNHAPDDWPGRGLIDLILHDPPHASSTTEWWYVNSHLETVTGDCLSLFACFFRQAVGKDAATGEFDYAHVLNWALVDAASGRYYTESLVDPRAPEIGLQKLDSGEGPADPLLRQALREVLEKGSVPGPDRLIRGPIRVAAERLDLDLGGNRFRREADGTYHLDLFSHESEAGCRLTFHPLKDAVRHGDDGLVRGVAGEGMFYYFIPRCRVEGEITVSGQTLPLKHGAGWYDHEFGRQAESDATKSGVSEIAWNWISAQLDDGSEVTVYDLFDMRRDGRGCGRWAIVIDPAGKRQEYRSFDFEPLEGWTSARTFVEYPVGWRLEVPEAGLRLVVEAAHEAQEFMTIISEPAFWEGRVRVRGTIGGRAVEGLGFVERAGFGAPGTLGDFLAAAGEQTRRSVRALLPLEPSYEQARRLIAREGHDHYLADLDLDQYARVVIGPIREVIDRGGKAWRSYAFLACIEAVGGDPQEFLDLLAVPELLHTGSLIVDDVEDRSTVRRGGPACHLVYGEALAINAGNAAYFLGQPLFDRARITDAQKLRCYEFYFEALRAAHAGQAADIDGLGAHVPRAVESGDGEVLERRVLAVHRLKSAAPPASLAMLGAVLGRGTPAQVEGMGHFFEAVGLAFQIMDDVLNLRGFEHDLKSKGEDISCGKVTMPVAKAMSRLGEKDRRALWATISARPTDPAVIAGVIARLESCGAIGACEEQARALVESAWRVLDPLLPDSRVKLTLRAFGWYILERTY